MKIWTILCFSLLSVFPLAKGAYANTVQICNYSTTSKVYVAYTTYVDGVWWVQGWRHIEQGNCSDFYHEGSSFYYYAEGSDDSEWSGDARFCVLGQQFKIVNVSSCDNGRWEYFTKKTGLGEFYKIRLTD